MDKKRIWEAVASILITAAIALLAVFGYNVTVVQPQLDAIGGQAEMREAASLGVEQTPCICLEPAP